jgi:DNA helicase-2/ATP-dependent DNA helicase PcrA
VKQTLKALNLAADDYDKMVAGRDPLKGMCNRISRFKDSLILPQEAEARAEAMILEANCTGMPADAPGSPFECTSVLRVSATTSRSEQY